MRPATGRRATLVAVITTAAVLPLVLAGCGAGAPAHPKYGGMPSYLPQSSLRSDSELVGTAHNPAITSQGDAVLASTANGSVRVTVSGPEVPGEGLPYQSPSTTCTWTVSLSGATAPTPIDVAEFTTIDHLGAVYHPALVAGAPAPPATLEPGQSVTFELRAIMQVGEGLMRWAPSGTQMVASWDFEVEND
jgi:hypothetical protein